MVESPHSTLCSPQIQISPGTLTGVSGTSGAASSSVKPPETLASSKNRLSSSSALKPKRSILKSKSSSADNSSRSRLSSQPAFSAILLSAITSARRCASFKWFRRMVGTFFMPSSFAAIKRPCPAMMILSSPSKIGFTKPNSVMDAAICATCVSECVRAFLAYGISSSTDTCSIFKSLDFASVMVFYFPPFAAVVRTPHA